MNWLVGSVPFDGHGFRASWQHESILADIDGMFTRMQGYLFWGILACGFSIDVDLTVIWLRCDCNSEGLIKIKEHFFRLAGCEIYRFIPSSQCLMDHPDIMSSG